MAIQGPYTALDKQAYPRAYYKLKDIEILEEEEGLVTCTYSFMMYPEAYDRKGIEGNQFKEDPISVWENIPKASFILMDSVKLWSRGYNLLLEGLEAEMTSRPVLEPSIFITKHPEVWEYLKV